jgi:hypothetical protein
MTDTVPAPASPPPSLPTLPPPTPGYVPAPQPAYTAPVYVQAPQPPATWPQVAPLDQRLSAAVTEYQKRNYKVQVSAGTSVTMERPATKFNWIVGLMLLFLVGVGAILYVLGWAIWGVHKTYRVTLSLGPQGVLEQGDVLATYDRDRLKIHRVRLICYGALFATIGALMLIGSIGSYVAPAADAEPIPVGGLVAMLVIGVALPVGVAVALFKAARDAASKLKGAAVAWAAGWYPDPDRGPGALRYFDGDAWTEDRSPASQAT